MLDNNAIERHFKDIVVERKNYLFCEGERSASNTSSIYSLIASCKLNNIDPFLYISDVLLRINDHNHLKLEELLPHKWSPIEREKIRNINGDIIDINVKFD